MTLRVLHAATHDHNIGDGALVAGIHATLRADLETEIDFVPLDVLGHKLRRRRRMLDKAEAKQLAARYDLVLVGGGGMIEGGRGNYLSGINFNFDLDLLERSEVPWAFYALGFNQFRGTHFFHRRRLERLLAIAERRGFPFSVRNDKSKQRLEALVGPRPFVRTVPDPGLWVPPRRHARPEIDPDKTNLLLQLAGDRPGARFSRRGERTLRRLAKLVESLTERHDLRVVLCPHLLTDLPVFAKLVERLPVRVVRESCTLTPVLKGAALAGDFFELYRQADLVVGMRGHSVICAVGVGTPVIGFATHDKVTGFFDEIGLPEWGVDLEADPKLEALERKIEQMLADLPAARETVSRPLADLRDQTRAFHREIAAVLGR
jgi:polysaccharide pyruvyl transferase WcaK-like protein